ncbi:unnamed protein product [Lymnaea stagnalis]|uniref:UBX domain-containing protein n=1 Tax=Lymnaea stagnalis TaxID=6523 RepID=A0AAV2IMQ7_LYMST
MQPKPPSSSGRPPTSGRPFSASTRPRSAARRSIDLTEHPSLSPEALTEQSPRPPSAFSKYQILPAIGSPTPPDQDQSQEFKTIHVRNKTQKDQDRQPHPYRLQSQVSPHLSSSSDSREPNVRSSSGSAPPAPSSRTAAGSDIQSSNKVEECIERLDLSQLEKSRRKKSTSNTSPSHAKSKTSAVHKVEHKPGEFYDADDDDSDSAYSNRVSSRQQQTKLSVKKPVVIPSPDHCPTRELLIAVKLPTDGTRHQRYFNSNESLQAVVDFAEEVAGQDFGGYILVSNAPRQVYRDLYETIENAGLQDKLVLHLEEND